MGTGAIIIVALTLGLARSEIRPGAAAPAAQPEAVLTVEDAGGANEIVIAGVADGKTTTFGRTLRIRSSVDLRGLELRASDLRTAAVPPITVDAANISIPATTPLVAGFTQSVRLSVQEVRRPGDYAGTVDVVGVTSDGKRIAAPALKLRLSVVPRPEVRPLAPSRLIQLTRSHSGLGARLDSYLLPAQLDGAARDIAFENATPGEVDVVDTQVVLLGEKSGLDAGQFVQLTWPPKPWPAQTLRSIQLRFDRDKIPADRYVGVLRVRLKDADDPVVLPMTVEMRNGPKAALLLLLAGVIAGRFMKAAKPQPGPAAAAGPAAPAPNRAVRAVQWAAGTQHKGSGSWAALAEAAGFLLLLVFLAVSGLQTLYVSGGATFGAGGLFEYVGLFIWGLSAEVAQRTLHGPK